MENIIQAISTPSFTEFISLVITGILTYLTKYVKDYLKSRRDNEEDALQVRKEENTIDNAIDYVKDVFDKEKERRPELTKIILALEYIEKVEPKVYNTSGEGRLEMMIKRKVYQKK